MPNISVYVVGMRDLLFNSDHLSASAMFSHGSLGFRGSSIILREGV